MFETFCIIALCYIAHKAYGKSRSLEPKPVRTKAIGRMREGSWLAIFFKPASATEVMLPRHPSSCVFRGQRQSYSLRNKGNAPAMLPSAMSHACILQEDSIIAGCMPFRAPTFQLEQHGGQRCRPLPSRDAGNRPQMRRETPNMPAWLAGDQEQI